MDGVCIAAVAVVDIDVVGAVVAVAVGVSEWVGVDEAELIPGLLLGVFVFVCLCPVFVCVVVVFVLVFVLVFRFVRCLLRNFHCCLVF